MFAPPLISIYMQLKNNILRFSELMDLEFIGYRHTALKYTSTGTSLILLDDFNIWIRFLAWSFKNLIINKLLVKYRKWRFRHKMDFLIFSQFPVPKVANSWTVEDITLYNEKWFVHFQKKSFGFIVHFDWTNGLTVKWIFF